MSSGIVPENSQIRAYSKRPSQREMDLNPNKPFDYAKLREAMEYAQQFEFQVNSAKLMEGANRMIAIKFIARVAVPLQKPNKVDAKRAQVESTKFYATFIKIGGV